MVRTANIAAALVFTLLASSSLAADLAAQSEAWLKQVAKGEDGNLDWVTTNSPKISVNNGEAVMHFEGLELVPRTGIGITIVVGKLDLHFRHRADGGLAISGILPSRVDFRDARNANGFTLEIGKNSVEFGAPPSLDRSDSVTLHADSLAMNKMGQVTLRTGDFALHQEQAGPARSGGRLALSMTDIMSQGAGAATAQVGSIALEMTFEDFPAERFALQSRQVRLWEQARIAQDGPASNLELLPQWIALLREAGTAYRIERLKITLPNASVQVQGDVKLSLAALRGFSGNMTMWLGGDLVNAIGKLGDQATGQMVQSQTNGILGAAVSGTDPAGQPALIYQMVLDEDGRLSVNGQYSAPASRALAGAQSSLALIAAGLQAPAINRPLTALPAGCGVPSYPAASVLAKEEGRVTITFDYDGDGRISNSRIETSGHPRLDDAALKAFITCRFPKGTKSATIPYLWHFDRNGNPAGEVGPEMKVQNN